MKKIVILYHDDCTDGFGAAWAAWKKFGSRADYLPIEAGQGPRQLPATPFKKCKIYFLDACAAPETLRKLVRENTSVMVIDHHATNKEKVRSATASLFDLKHSGSVLAWKYFHPKKAIPWLLRYVEDGDLWNDHLPHADEISIWLDSVRFEFNIWNRLARDMERASFRARAAKEGKLLLAYEDGIVRGILKNAYEVRFKGHRARVANTSVAHSQVGHRLLDREHPVGIVWYEDGTIRKYSLRSEGTMDVSKLAKQFPGGGGHKHAAGFSTPIAQKFPWKIIKQKNGK